MSAKTKIVVLHMKELIYTGIFTALGVLLIILLFVLFLSGDSTENSSQPGASPSSESTTGTTGESNTDATTGTSVSYIPGIYTTQLSLGSQTVDVEVILDEHSITSIELINLDESVATMYPLLESTFDTLCEQIYSAQSTEGLTYSSENKYTSIVLVNAIQEAINKGKASDTESTEATDSTNAIDTTESAETNSTVPAATADSNTSL